jgi:hypothetical protein
VKGNPGKAALSVNGPNLFPEATKLAEPAGRAL